MIVLTLKEVHTLLPMPTVIDLVAQAMITTSRGGATLPLRSAMVLDQPNMLGIMPGALSEPACFGTKLISLYPQNPTHGHSSHLGMMVLFEREFGTPIALMDAGILTALRTAAASAVATKALARKDANILAIIGTGEQAENHIQALQHVRDITRINIAGRTPARAAEFVDKIAGRFANVTFIPCQSVKKAVEDADIICTVTSSRETILHGEWVAPGTHVNAVGASMPSLREIDETLVRRAALYVDYRASALAQARDIIEALANGAITENHILGEIGEVLDRRVAGRTDDTAITLYRSMGIAAQDLICAHHAAQQAKAKGIGTEVSIA